MAERTQEKETTERVRRSDESEKSGRPQAIGTKSACEVLGVKRRSVTIGGLRRTLREPLWNRSLYRRNRSSTVDLQRRSNERRQVSGRASYKRSESDRAF